MTTTLERSGREIWRSVRTPVLVITGILVAAVAIFVATGARTSGPFSPDSTEKTGARALRALLENHGVQVTATNDLVDATASGADRTLLVAPGGALGEQDWERINRAGWSHVVLVRPPRTALRVLAPGVEPAGTVTEDSRDAGCDLPAAVKAGTATVSGSTYSIPESAVGCYGDGIHNTVVRLTRDDRIVDVVGTPRTFTNDILDEDGNAALALDLIGTHGRLVWYLPGFETDEAAEDGDPIVPPWVHHVAWMSGIAVLVIAFWRGRRLGPVVPEPLPVIVHAAETTEGRARLYRRSQARDRAAAALRESALGRLQRLHGIGRRTEPVAVVSTVAASTGHDPASLHHLLYGPPPIDDDSLLDLSRRLDQLTQEVRRP